MTEFALVLPLIVLLLFGIIEFGMTFNDYISLTDAVRAGGRKGAVARHDSDPVAATIAQVRDTGEDLNPADLQVEVESSWSVGDDVRVSASYPYSIELLGITIRSGRLNSTTVERVE
jgi:Flp pilus assembly protein TadG